MRLPSFAREVFRQVPSASLADTGGEHLGGISVGTTEREISIDGHNLATPTARDATRFQVALPPARPALPMQAVTYQQPCLCCAAQGDGEHERCDALQLLATLQEEMDARDEIIELELEQGLELELLHRQARFFMYRAFVAAKYGHLGQGNRVQLPDCVVAAIRSRFRAPSCDCLGAQLVACRVHGYTGYRER